MDVGHIKLLQASSIALKPYTDVETEFNLKLGQTEILLRKCFASSTKKLSFSNFTVNLSLLLGSSFTS